LDALELCLILKKAEKPADDDDNDEGRFLPESDQAEDFEAETYVSPALKALMAK